MNKDKNKIYIILPYISLQKTTIIEDICFKPLFELGKTLTNNLDKELKNDKYHLSNIINSFHYNFSPVTMTYAIEEIDSIEALTELKKKFNIALNIIRYKALEDEKGSISFAQTVSYIFQLTFEEWKSKARKSGDKDFLFYRGFRDFNEEINLSWPQEKIYPPKERISIGDLYLEDNNLLKNLGVKDWESRGWDREERQRIFRAVEHYNNSFIEGIGIDDRHRILNLAAGFEALYNLPDESIGKSFEAMVKTFFGDIEELRSWSKNFYDLRSKIIHGEEISLVPRLRTTRKERETPSIYYRHPKGDKEYINNLRIGRSIFRKSLRIILRVRLEEYSLDLQRMLRPTELIIKQIQQKLPLLKDKNSIDEWYETGLTTLYDQLSTKDYTAELNTVFDIGKEFLNTLKIYLKNKKSPADNEINAIINFSGKFIDLAMLFHDLDNKITPYRKSTGLDEKVLALTLPELAFENAIRAFITYCSYVFISSREVVKTKKS